MDKKKLTEWDRRYVWHPFTPMSVYAEEEPLIIERGEGMYIFDVDGNKYIDGISSLWVNVHGHRHPKIDAAVRAQLDKIAHATLLGSANVPSIELAKRLVEITPPGLDKVFYSDSGSTGVEIALKIAYQYHRQRPDGGERRTFVGFTNAYHGDTVGSVSVGGIDLFHGSYRNLLFETVKVPSPYSYRCPFGTDDPEACGDACLAELEKTLDGRSEEIAAVVIEPVVQGAAGIIVQPPGFVGRVRELTKKHGVLMIADEVAVGFGRTGLMFACEHDGVSPDIMVVAKGLTGGYLPVAATLTTDEIYEQFLGPREAHRTFYHGHSYTGNPLGCAAALACLDIFAEEKTIENMQPKIELMSSKLEEIAEHENVGEVRRKGFMTGIELVKDRATREAFDEKLAVGHSVTLEARKLGALVRPLGDVVVLMPPPAIDGETLEKLLDITHDAIKMATSNAGSAE